MGADCYLVELARSPVAVIMTDLFPMPGCHVEQITLEGPDPYVDGDVSGQGSADAPSRGQVVSPRQIRRLLCLPVRTRSQQICDIVSVSFRGEHKADQASEFSRISLTG